MKDRFSDLDTETFFDLFKQKLLGEALTDARENFFVVDSQQEWDDLCASLVKQAVEKVGKEQLGMLAMAFLDGAIKSELLKVRIETPKSIAELTWSHAEEQRLTLADKKSRYHLLFETK